MLKLKLTLLALEDIRISGYELGETVEIISDVFDKFVGIAFEPLDKRWKVIKMEIIEYRPLDIQIEED